MQDDRIELIQAIAVTAELTGTELSQAAKQAMVEDLSGFAHAQVIAALNRCRKELRGRMTISDVIGRLDDGRPGPEQAWALSPKSESETAIWTEEMAKAYGVAAPLIQSGDTIQARMAFLEVYRAEVAKARDERLPVKWQISLGHDPQEREAVIVQAVADGKIGMDRATALIPNMAEKQKKLTKKEKENQKQLMVELNKNPLRA